jgi:hypothetical protein
MQTRIIHSAVTVWSSDVLPEVATDAPALAEVIAWADRHPHVWKIVTGARSKAFGLGSCEYIGWAQRGAAPEAVLERARHLHGLVTGRDARPGPSSIFAWRARFTFEHYRDRGFTGGFFQQHDTRFPRLCLTLDYTPATLEAVLDRFLAWCERDHPTDRVTLNGAIVRRLGGTGQG